MNIYCIVPYSLKITQQNELKIQLILKKKTYLLCIYKVLIFIINSISEGVKYKQNVTNIRYQIMVKSHFSEKLIHPLRLHQL